MTLPVEDSERIREAAETMVKALAHASKDTIAARWYEINEAYYGLCSALYPTAHGLPGMDVSHRWCPQCYSGNPCERHIKG